MWEKVAAVSVAMCAVATFQSTPDETGGEIPVGTPRAGTFTMTAPSGPLNVGSVAPGGTISRQLGGVTVVNKAFGVTSWAARVSTTDFTTGIGGTGQTITKANISYWSGPSTGTTGPGNFVPAQPTAANAVSLSVTRAAFSLLTGGNGNNSASWNPTVVIRVPVAVLPGTYTGRITHSVA